MRNARPSAFGILAGGGNLPVEIAASLKARGASVKIIAMKGEADAVLDSLDPTYVHWGQVGTLIKILKDHGCANLVIVGRVARPDLGALKPDLGLITAIPTILRLIRAGGDDALLRGVIEFFLKNGIKVVSPAQIAPELIINDGPFCDTRIPEKFSNDIARGFALIRALAPFDIGQSVVMNNGTIESIEGVEGTDAMLNRISARRRMNEPSQKTEGPSGILIKRPKPGQDLRVDLPVIGPETAMRCAQTNLSGIVVEAGKVLAVERHDLKTFANAHSLFIEGAREENTIEASQSSPLGIEPMTARVKGRVRASKLSLKDAKRGTQLLEALTEFDQNWIAIVSRGHVLTLDATDHRTEAIKRSAKLRQWGDKRWRARIGVAVLSAGREVDEQTIKEAAQSGLAAIAVRLTKFAATVSPPMIALADRHGISIIEVFLGQGA